MKPQIERIACETAPHGKAAPLVVIVLVNYNCANDTKVCILSLERLHDPSFRIVVVDNSSTSDDVEALQGFVMRRGHSFLAMPENGGFAAANNVGIHFARALNAEYVWLLNPDTVVDPRALHELRAFSEHAARPVVCGSKVLYGSLDPEVALHDAQGYTPGTGRIWSAGGGVDFFNQSVSMHGWDMPDGAEFNSPSACDYLPGCSMFVPLSVVDLVGGMPEEFFLYFEETEWCTRMRERDIELQFVPSSVVWHRFKDEKMQTARTVYYYNRNELAFWYRHSGWKKRLRTIARIVLRKLPEVQKAIRQAPDDEQRQVFRAHRRACLDFLRGRMGRQSI
ncbi:MAG: glycosyltransferase family 2 protein [Bdellovibrionota bacterium]